jgi:hypothetical protein
VEVRRRISVLLGNTEVYEIYSAGIATSADEDIGGLDIPMNEVA